MTFEDPLAITADGHRLTVQGRPLCGRPISVTMDDKRATLPLAGDRETISKPAKFIARYSNGASVVDKPAKQVLRLPNGTTVERKPARTVVTFSDGSQFVEKPAKTSFRGVRL